MNIALFYGGQSGEHEVSCVSARFLEKKILEYGYQVVPVYISRNGAWHRQQKVHENESEHKNDLCFLKKDLSKVYLVDSTAGQMAIDFAFSIIHGTTGEDGAIQGLFEMYSLAYAGCNLSASSLAMNKILSRDIFSMRGIAQVKYKGYHQRDFSSLEKVADDVMENFSGSMFIKPANLGSSVGISKVKNNDNLKEALDLAFSFDENIIVEEGLEVRELEIGILGNYPHYDVSSIGEIITHHDFYSYDAKYIDKDGATLQIPAKLTKAQELEIAGLAKEAFGALKGDGYARVDFFMEKKTGRILLNEINTVPGFTPSSMLPVLWENAKVGGVELVKKIVNLGLERFEIQSSKQRSRV